MRYDDLIYGFQSKTLSLGYFKQFIYGYEDRINTVRTKDPDNDPEDFPILLMPPQNSESTRDKVQRFRPLSIAGHKMPKQQKNVTLTISSDVVTFSTTKFVTGETVVFTDGRTGYEIIIKVTVSGGTATGTSQISLTDGTQISKVEEDHATIHADLEENMMDILDAMAVGFTDKTGAAVVPQAVSTETRVIRLDQWGSRGYVRVMMEFTADIKNCAL